MGAPRCGSERPHPTARPGGRGLSSNASHCANCPIRSARVTVNCVGINRARQTALRSRSHQRNEPHRVCRRHVDVSCAAMVRVSSAAGRTERADAILTPSKVHANKTHRLASPK